MQDTKTIIETAMQALVDNDITAECSEVGDRQYLITSPDELMDNVALALGDSLDEQGAVDYSIAHTDTVLSLII